MKQIVKTPADIGDLLRKARKESGLTQSSLALVSGTGNRVIVDAENGKPTTQIAKILTLLNMVGLEVVIQTKGEPLEND